MSFITFILGLAIGVVIGFCICFRITCEEILENMTPDELTEYLGLVKNKD